MLHAPSPQLKDDAGASTLQSWEGLPSNSCSNGNVDDLALRLHAERARHLRYLRSRLPTAEDAEDALQDATLKFLQNANAFASVEKPEAWVSVSLRRMVVDRYRRAAAHRRMTEALAAEPREPTGCDDDLLIPTECLKSTLQALKPDYGSILQQVYLQEAPLKDVAARLDLTSNNAAVRVHRARNALREAMLQKCRSCPLADCWARQRFATAAAA